MTEGRYQISEADRCEHIDQMLNDTSLTVLGVRVGIKISCIYVNRRDGCAWVSVAEIADELGASQRAVTRVISEQLKDRHFHVTYRNRDTSLYKPIRRVNPDRPVTRSPDPPVSQPRLASDSDPDRPVTQYSDHHSESISESNSEQPSCYQDGGVSNDRGKPESLSPADISKAQNLILMADFTDRLDVETLAKQFLAARRKRGHSGPIGNGFERYVRSAISRAHTSWRVGKSRQQTIAEWERQMTREGEE